MPVSLGILAGTPRPVLQGWLAEAQQAYADLMAGKKVVSATYTQGNGTKAVTFTQADTAKLTSWILQLQQALGIRRRPRAPMRPYFL